MIATETDMLNALSWTFSTVVHVIVTDITVRIVFAILKEDGS